MPAVDVSHIPSRFSLLQRTVVRRFLCTPSLVQNNLHAIDSRQIHLGNCGTCVSNRNVMREYISSPTETILLQ